MTDVPRDPSETDPFALARKQAEAERPKRFYKDVAVEETPEGFAVLLDRRPLRTPAKQALAAPRPAIAEAFTEGDLSKRALDW